MSLIINNESYPPLLTGNNNNQAEIVVFNNNVVDSVAGTELGDFVTVKHNNNGFFPQPIYDTGALSIDPNEVKLTNMTSNVFSFILDVRSAFISDSTSNTANIGIRLNSTTIVIPSTEEIKAAGITIGATTVSATLGTFGVFALAPGESAFLEVTKNYEGICVMDSALLLVRPLW